MIVVFSGTGNSMRVARLLSQDLGDKIVSLPADLTDIGTERIIWVFPIYSWGLPPIVQKAIEAVNGNQNSTYMVATCGDDIGRADRRWAKAVSKRGLRPMGAFSVQMPNTYVLMKGFDVDSEELAKSKIEAAPNRVAIIAEAIRESSNSGIAAPTDVVSGAFAGIKTAIIYPWFKRYAMSPEPFYADNRCVGCEKCARYCPLQNIIMDANHRPQWGNNCTLCLRCYHICPTHAVCYSTTTRNKGQSQLLLSELHPQTH